MDLGWALALGGPGGPGRAEPNGAYSAIGPRVNCVYKNKSQAWCTVYLIQKAEDSEAAGVAANRTCRTRAVVPPSPSACAARAGRPATSCISHPHLRTAYKQRQSAKSLVTREANMEPKSSLQAPGSEARVGLEVWDTLCWCPCGCSVKRSTLL